MPKPQTLIYRPLVLAIFWLATLPILAIGTIEFSLELFQKIEREYGKEASERVENWQHLLQQQEYQDEQDKLEKVNDFFNQRRFIDDYVHWQKQDYWATPLEFLATDGGDCEDFSIAKYVSLRQLGVPAEKMRLMYVKALKLNQAHMVLAYYPEANAIPLVLDNLDKQIKPATRRKDLLPVYSFNGDGLWLAKAQGRGKKVQPEGSHSLWEEVADRIERGQ